MFEKSGKIGKKSGMDDEDARPFVFLDNQEFCKGHVRLKTSLNNMANRLLLIEKSWHRMNRKAFMPELMRMLGKVHSMEEEIEKLEDPIARALGYEYIDKLASQRRFLLEEIRWDIASS